MEPVQIDFMIGGNVESEGKKVEDQFGKIGASAKQAKAEIMAQIREQRNVIKQIEQDIKSTEQLISKTAPGKEQLYLISELKAMKKVLLEEKGALNGLQQELDKTALTYERMTSKVAQAKDTLAKLDAQGLRGSAQWNAVSKELEGYAQALKSAQMQTQVLADPNAGFKAVAGGVSALSGALTAGIGVASLFGAEQEQLAKIQTRLQAAMAITMGIQQVAEQLNKSSYLATVLLTKAKAGLAAANLWVANTFRISTAAAAGFMAVVTLGLTAGIIALINWYEKLKTKEEEQKRIVLERLKFEEELRKEVASGYAAEVSKIEAARAALSSENVTRNQKLAIIKKLQDQIPGYTAELDAEGRLIRENTTAYDNYLIALEKSLLLRAAEKDLEQLLEKKYKLQKLKPQKDDNPLTAGLYKEKNVAEKLAEDIEPAIDATIAEIDEGINKIKKYISESSLIELTKPTKPTNPTTPKGATTAAKEQYNAEEELQKKILQLQQQTAKLQIDQMKDGLEKRLAQIEFDKNAELAKLADSQQAIVDAYNKSHKDEKGFKPVEKIEDIPGIKPETLQTWADEVQKITDDAEWNRVEAVNKANAEIIKLADSYGSERTQIAFSYAEDIEKLEAAGQTEAAAAARAERDRKISDVTAEMITTTDLYRTATDEKLLISKEATERLIEDIKQRIAAEQAAGNLSKEKAKELLDELDSAGVGRTESKNSYNPFAQLIEGLNEYKKAKEDLANKRDTATPEEFAKLESAANTSLQSTATATGAALQGVQSILGGVIDGLDQLGLLTEEEKQTANEVIGMVGGAADIAMGIASGNPVQIIQGSIQLLVNGLKLFDKKSKDIAKEQKKRKEELESLAEAYRKLQREASKALGSDVFKLLKESIATQKKQIDEYERLIKLEEQKKKKKQNQEDIEEWKRRIAELKEGIEDTLGEIRDKLTGTDTHTMANDLASALVSAFEQGEDAAEAFGKVFDSVIRNAVLNAYKMKYLEKPIDEWLTNLGNYMDDGELSEWEKRMLEAQRDTIFANAKNGWEAISGLWSVDGSMGGAKGIQGDVKNISEETGTKLAGAVNAMRLNVDEIVRHNRSSIDAMGKQLAALEEIKSNTSFCRRLERMDETLYYLKVNGIKVT